VIVISCLASAQDNCPAQGQSGKEYKISFGNTLYYKLVSEKTALMNILKS
jgi:hypothetical protein